MAGPLNSTALLLLTLFSISTLLLSSASAGCYNPDGTDRNAQNNNSAYQPCNNTAAVSMCCNMVPNTVGGDICIPGGLCYNPTVNLYWRESCTDQTWMSPACTKLFLNGTGGSLAGDTVITPCDDGSWCYSYGLSALECCENGNGLFIVNGTETTHNPSTASSPSISTTTITTTTVITPPPSPSASSTSIMSPPSGLSLGAKIGLGVGIGVGGIAVLVIIGVYVWARHHTTGPAAPRPERKVTTAAISHEAPLRPELGTDHFWRPTELRGSGAWDGHHAELQS
jgi:hypothetical protein